MAMSRRRLMLPAMLVLLSVYLLLESAVPTRATFRKKSRADRFRSARAFAA
jgi:hypothetical protein